MTVKENWIMNIMDAITYITSKLDDSVVESILNRYGARSVWDLNSKDLPSVFDDLSAIEADLK